MDPKQVRVGDGKLLGCSRASKKEVQHAGLLSYRRVQAAKQTSKECCLP